MREVEYEVTLDIIGTVLLCGLITREREHPTYDDPGSVAEGRLTHIWAGGRHYNQGLIWPEMWECLEDVFADTVAEREE